MMDRKMVNFIKEQRLLKKQRISLRNRVLQSGQLIEIRRLLLKK